MLKCKINELLVDLNTFWSKFEPEYKKSLISSGEIKRNQSTLMSMPELMAISISFHKSCYRNFKAYYFEYLNVHCSDIFPKLLSYNRIMELDPGVILLTTTKKNIKNTLIPIRDKILLRHRVIIETVNDELNNISQIEHTRHRSEFGFFINLVSGLISYRLKPNKTFLNITEDPDFDQKTESYTLSLNCA